MTGEQDILPLFLEIAASPAGMRRAITEACNCMLEGMGPSFATLRRYLNSINDGTETAGPDFADLWERSGEPGTPSGVIHFLTSGLPEGRRALDSIVRMGLGESLLFVPGNDETELERENLGEDGVSLLKSAKGAADTDAVTVAEILDTVPHCAMAVLSQTLGDWYNSDERNLGMPEEPGKGRVVNGWLVHNSDRAMDIYREGFAVGQPIGYLAYGKCTASEDDNYGFAFRIDDAPEPAREDSGLKYTRFASGGSIVFRGTGNAVDHYGDRERQVIFDIHDPTGCFLVIPSGKTGWSVWGKNTGRPLLSGKTYRGCLEWIKENGWQYRNQMKEWDRK